jgi:EPS-associated MarR family transcriptional regulator
LILQNDELTLAILRHAESTRTQKSLAVELGYSVGKINYILKALIAKGLIKAENFATSTHKKQYRYLLTREGIEAKIALTEAFIERKKREYEDLVVELDEIKRMKYGH